jgi:transposase
MVHDLRVLLRLAQGRTAEPSAMILDSRTLQSSPESGARAGYDGHKRKKGSKLHLAVDTLGHLLALHVTPANEQDRAVAASHGIEWMVVKLPEAKRGFVLLPKRWVVERSFAWTTRFRRLVRDYERLPETLGGLHFVAFACLMLSRVVPVLLAGS